jgi:hypothetical protein
MAASATTDVLDTFAPISLADMDGVKLQDRVDTKYVFGEAELPEVLAAMLPHYRVLEVNGMRGTKYSSLYYDTADLQHYKDHHNGRTFRSKVRFREYLGADLVFLEVKRKTGRGRTDKKRILVPAIPLTLDPSQQEFVSKANGQDHPCTPPCGIISHGTPS